MTFHEEEGRRHYWVVLVSTAMLTNPAGVLGAITPAIITSFVTEAGLPLDHATQLVALEFATMTIAIMGGPLLIKRIGNRRFAVVALLATLVGELVSTWVAEPFMEVARGIMGIGEGALYGLALAVLARTPRPARAFGVVVLTNQIVSALLLAMSGWSHRLYPASGIFTLMTFFLVATACFLPTIASHPIERTEQITGDAADSFAILPGIVGVFFFASAFGMVWPVIASIGQARGVSGHNTEALLGVSGIAGIVGAGSAILLADRVGRMLPLVIGSVVMSLALFGAFHWAFGVATPAILFLWSFLVPYYLGSATAADRTGRLVGVTGAMLPSGIAAGQAIATYLLRQKNYEEIAPSAVTMQIVGMLLILVLSTRLWSIRRADTLV